MTEPQGGSDPGLFVTGAQRDGDDWVINGEKWFSSNARYASFFIVMAVTNPEARTHQKMSLFIVPAETPVSRSFATSASAANPPIVLHGYVRYTDVGARRPCARRRGRQAFAIAQTRLGVAECIMR